MAPWAQRANQTKVQFFLEVQVGIEQIIQEPEKFQDFCEAIRDRIISEENVDQDALGTISSIIVNMALGADNVSYPIGKLSVYLCEELAFLPESAPQRRFQGEFLSVCHMVHQDRFTVLESDSDRLRRFAVFMAELFIQLKTPQGKHLNVLGKAMLEQINTLMTPLVNQQHITEQNLKSVIRILKCCGSALEGMSNEEKYVVNSTIIQLQTLKDEVNISQNTKQAIVDLAALQKNGWQYVQPTGAGGRRAQNGTSNGIFEREDYLAPVMWGPDGNPLTEEEAAFLQEHLGRQDSSMSSGSIPGPNPSDFIDNNSPPEDNVPEELNSPPRNSEKGGKPSDPSSK
jgi:hypothetical protein